MGVTFDPLSSILSKRVSIGEIVSHGSMLAGPLQASRKAIEMLAGDKANDDRKKAIRASAEEKIAKLKGDGK